ncbi:glycosyltransferase [Vibrio sp.]|nr:glycosyltransferase [Vibrio sp.]
MKILYGVQGTGNGHIARARAMSSSLRHHGVDVDFFFSGRSPERYFSMECFGQYRAKSGLSFVSSGGKVDYVKTAIKSRFCRFLLDIHQLDLSSYDLVLNDFEPISAWAAKRQKKTCISISHQNAFRYQVPLKGASWLDRKIITNYAPADHHVGLHWYHFDQMILPPIVHHAQHRNENKGFVLVYLPFENVDDIYELLFRFSNYQFICFHPDIKSSEMQNNVHFYPPCHDDFQRYLYACSGVIANGGFELPSEAMSLGKKLLLKPLSGQFEQQSNVATLEMLGLASTMDKLDPSVVRHWLDEQSGEKVSYPDVANAITEWVLSGHWDNHQQLCESLWKQVDFPSYVSIN